MEKYKDLALFLLILILALTSVNYLNNITGMAIGDNGTVIDTNGTIIYVNIFYPNDYYNSSKQNLTFILKTNGADSLYHRVNSLNWNVDLVNNPQIDILISLENGLNTVYFYACRNEYCSLTKNVKVYANFSNLTSTSLVSNTNVSSNVSQNNVIVDIPQNNSILSETSTIASEAKKLGLSKLISIGFMVILVIYLIGLKIYEKKQNSNVEAKS